MTSKPDLGVIVAIVSGVAVIAAIVAGLATVGSPGDARDQRLDDAHYQAIGEIATAAECVYSETDVLPESIADARTQVASLYFGARSLECGSVRPGLEAAISYDIAALDQVNLCADFRRPSPTGDRQQFRVYFERFPELAEPRTEIGRRCYLIQVRPL